MSAEKEVGRRKVRERATREEALAWQDEVARTFGRAELCERGVFRFPTFEEADAWLTDRKAKRQLELRRRRASR